MTDLPGDREHIEYYGSIEATELARIVNSSASSFGGAAWDGMETLKRLSDLELEHYTMRQLVSRGYSFTFKSDGVKVTILDGNFYLARNLTDAIYHLAGTFCIPAYDGNPLTKTDTWPDELKEKVLFYLASQGLTIHQEIGPPGSSAGTFRRMTSADYAELPEPPESYLKALAQEVPVCDAECNNPDDALPDLQKK